MSKIYGNPLTTPINPEKLGGGVSTYYHTTREGLVIGSTTNSDENANANYIWGLYDALINKYPTNVQKNEIRNDDGTFTNYEYVISTREYPTDGLYAQSYSSDPHIKKPKYLILSGIHGEERKNCLSTYRFIRDVLSGHNVPQSFREGVTLCVMPVGNPSGINGYTRGNDNGVDINRNFNWNWVKAAGNSTAYGVSAASEKETQAIVNWLESHSDADLFIDFHNNGRINENVAIIGLPEKSDTAKKIALRGIDRVVPFWRDVIAYPKTMKMTSLQWNEETGAFDTINVVRNVIFSYSASVDSNGMAFGYAHYVLGINSLAMETSVYYGEDKAVWEKDNHLCPPETIAMGAEALGNILIEFYAQEDMTMPDGAHIYNGEAVLNINTKTHTRYKGEAE